VHGADAQYVAQNVYKTSTVIKYLGTKSNPLASVTLSMTVAKTFLREALTTGQLRIEIWKGEGGKKNASKYSLNKQVCCPSMPVEQIIIAVCIGFSWEPSRSRRTHLWERRFDGGPYCLCFEDRQGERHPNGWRRFCRCLGAGNSGFSIRGERYVLQCRGMHFSFRAPLQLPDSESLFSLSLSNWESRNALYKEILRAVTTNWSSCIKSWKGATL
jgi:MutS domain I